jgi:signal transduction histidine kinase
MKKTIQKLWNEYFQPAMIRASEEQADSLALLELTKRVGEEYTNRRQVKVSSDAELGNKFRKLFDNSLVAMSFYDKEGHLIDLNDKMREICGFDLFGADFFWKTRLFDAPGFKGDLDPTSTEPFITCQHMNYPELDINRYVEVRVQPTLDAKQEIKYYVITTRDITNERIIYIEQEKKEKELARISTIVSDYEQKLNYLLRSSNMFTWWYDPTTRQISFSRSLKKQEIQESIDEYIESLYEDEREETVERIKNLITAPHAFNVKHHFRYTPINPNPQWLYINGQPVVNEQGKVIALFGLLRDITAMMETQYQLQKETRRAEASGIMKSAFLANMSHEIRTPLNAIVGFSDLLHVVDDPAERQEFIRIIRNNCDMLLRLINDILEASDMVQALAIEPTDIDFAQVFDDICQTVAQRVQEPGVEFLSKNPYATYPTTLDKGRVQQIITNFVSNAIKYTHEGHIKVGYRSEERNGRDGLYIYCEDTGAGIPKDKQDSVFDRFVKLNDQVQGTGLGLSICKNIVDHCNGQIGVSSEGPGRGTTFWFWLPCPAPVIPNSQNITSNSESYANQ